VSQSSSTIAPGNPPGLWWFWALEIFKSSPKWFWCSVEIGGGGGDKDTSDDFYVLFQNFRSWMNVVEHDCNPSTLEAEPGGSWVNASVGYIARPYLQKENDQIWWCTPVIPNTEEAGVGLQSKASPRQKLKALSGK
jgi:hypothetical protein